MSSNDESLKDTKSLHKTSVSDEVVIKFDHVTKTYNLYKNDRGRFLGIFNYNRKGSFLGSVDASKDLSFEIKKGEAVAFLGRNGAGKSTTLKMVTGVTHPTSGDIEVKGRVSALLELTAGFDSQLTGRENINLRGQILGDTRPRTPDHRVCRARLVHRPADAHILERYESAFGLCVRCCHRPRDTRRRRGPFGGRPGFPEEVHQPHTRDHDGRERHGAVRDAYVRDREVSCWTRGRRCSTVRSTMQRHITRRITKRARS